MNIEEIKKEILIAKNCQFHMNITNNNEVVKYIKIDTVLEILNKHNNQQSLVTLKDFENVSNKLIDYKSVLDEIFEKSHYKNITMEDMIEFYKKYNLGGK